MRIPTQLVELGRAIELDSTLWEWTWNLKDNMNVYCTPDGKKIVLVSNKTLKGKFKDPKIEKEQDRSQAKRLYSRFQGFKYDKGTGYDLPRDPTLKRVGSALHIVYQSDKFYEKNQQYIHDFKCCPAIWLGKPARPLIIVISSKKIRVTARGIEG